MSSHVTDIVIELLMGSDPCICPEGIMQLDMCVSVCAHAQKCVII